VVDQVEEQVAVGAATLPGPCVAWGRMQALYALHPS